MTLAEIWTYSRTRQSFRIVLPPLRFMLDLLKTSIEAMDKTGEAFHYLIRKFPRLNEKKKKINLIKLISFACWKDYGAFTNHSGPIHLGRIHCSLRINMKRIKDKVQMSILNTFYTIFKSSLFFCNLFYFGNFNTFYFY